MDGIVGRATGAMRANDVAGDCDRDGAPATGCSRVFVACVNEAIEQSGEKKQALAGEAGYSEFQFSRIRSCQSGALDFPDRLPEPMQRDIARRYAEAHGFSVHEPTETERAARICAAFEHLTREVEAITAVHLRQQMRGRR